MKLLKYKRIIVILISLSLIFAFGVMTSAAQEKEIRDFLQKKVAPSAAQEKVKINEVTESVTTSYYGTSKELPLGPDRMYGTMETFGVTVSDTGEGLFHNATMRCILARFVEKGSWQGEGYCTYTLKDGEKVFIRATLDGKIGTPPPPSKGTAEMIGGTGKYSGIQGRTEFTSYFVRPSAEGILQSYNKSKIIYRLP
jgi:hypothetical protein